MTRENRLNCRKDDARPLPLDEAAQIASDPNRRLTNRSSTKFRKSLQVGVGAVALECLLIGKRNEVNLVRMLRRRFTGESNPSLEAAAIALHNRLGRGLELREFGLAPRMNEKRGDYGQLMQHAKMLVA